MTPPETSVVVPSRSGVVLHSPARASVGTLHAIAAVVVAIVPLAVFAPALWNGFVWDDAFNLQMNRDYRGLGWTQLQWMLTTSLGSHWIPVTWLSFGLDYLVWGMNPAGYHLGNVLLHAGNACLFFVVALHLLRLGIPTVDARALVAGATAVSLFFSIHPLRTESVAWITERRDVLSGFLFLLAVLTYLRAHEPGPGRPRRWLAVSVACFQVAVLAKSIVVTLPVILILLDIYPLRRLKASPTRWLRIRNRQVLLEKLPFLPLAVVGSFVATSIIGQRHEFTSLSLPERLATIVYSSWFYLWKTLLPLGLSPLYEFPAKLDPGESRFVIAAVASLAVTVLGVALVRWSPAPLSAWLAYLVIMAPVSGIRHTGVQLVADRYSYLSCLPWALLLGGAVCLVMRAHLTGRLTPPRFRILAIGLALWILTLAALTARQTMIWRSSETLWRHAVASDPRCFVCQHNLGATLLHDNQLNGAIDHLTRAATLRPPAALSHGALVFAYLAADAATDARAHLEAVRVSDPALARDLSALFVPTW